MHLRDLAPSLSQGAVVASKSTVPVGLVARFQQTLDGPGTIATVVSNPDFLGEDSAVGDFFGPDRSATGSKNQVASEPLLEIYPPTDTGAHHRLRLP